MDLLFIANNKLVARSNMCASSFGSKILDRITEDETLRVENSSKKYGMHAYVTDTFRKISNC